MQEQNQCMFNKRWWAALKSKQRCHRGSDVLFIVYTLKSFYPNDKSKSQNLHTAPSPALPGCYVYVAKSIWSQLNPNKEPFRPNVNWSEHGFSHAQANACTLSRSLTLDTWTVCSSASLTEWPPPSLCVASCLLLPFPFDSSHLFALAFALSSDLGPLNHPSSLLFPLRCYCPTPADPHTPTNTHTFL